MSGFNLVQNSGILFDPEIGANIAAIPTNLSHEVKWS